MDMAVKMFFGHMSTDTELAVLRDMVKVMDVGTLISHESIEATIGVKRNTGRYRGIVERLKKVMLSEFNIELKSRRGDGYAVLTPSERVSSVIAGSGKVHRQIRKTHARAVLIPRTDLAPEEARKADHVQMVMGKMNDDLSLLRKKIAPPSRTVALP